MGTRLYVGNLPFSTDEASLRALFEQNGQKVTDVKIVTDRDTGRSRGFGFVEMSTDVEAKAAIETYNGYAWGGRTLTVNEAQEKPRGGSAGGGFRGAPGGGGGAGGFRGGGGGGGGGGAGGGYRGGAAGGGGGAGGFRGGGGGGADRGGAPPADAGAPGGRPPRSRGGGGKDRDRSDKDRDDD